MNKYVCITLPSMKNCLIWIKSRLFTKLIWQLVSIIKAYTLKIVMINILKLGGP